MKETVTIKSRSGVTRPLELYTPAREREFDKAEAELADWLARELALRPARETKR